MTLPPSYKTTSEYFRDSLKFLKTHQWLYNCSNTDILVNNTFANFPSEWLDYFQNLTNEELNKLPLNYVQENCPTSLRQFLDDAERLKPNITVQQKINNGYEFPHNSGLSKKKSHEISSIAPLVHDLCQGNGLDSIIDVGCGLGYLSHHLNERYQYRVLGLECSKEYISLGYKNQQKFHPQSKGEVIFVEHLIDENSAQEITRIAEQFLDWKKCCIIGLHACADLSLTILDLFEKLDFVSCLAIMPCCYHRIKLDRAQGDGDEEHFRNFPLSEALMNAFEEYGAHHFLKRPFLRLACQQSKGTFAAMTEEEHDRHARNFMFRAILQEVAVEENCRVTRLKRKSHKSRLADQDADFSAYLTSLERSHRLERLDPENDRPLDVDDERFASKMLEKWRQHKGECRLVEALTGLQASIQGVCENVVLLDRVEHLRRKGFRCRVEKVIDDMVSPRCNVLIAVKGAVSYSDDDGR